MSVTSVRSLSGVTDPLPPQSHHTAKKNTIAMKLTPITHEIGSQDKANGGGVSVSVSSYAVLFLWLLFYSFLFFIDSFKIDVFIIYGISLYFRK